jgi:autoinducer 2-degrading protein
MIHVLARWRAEIGKHSEVMLHLQSVISASRKEPGNRRYDVYQNIEDPHQFLLDELYVSEEAVQAHRTSEHFVSIVQGKIAPLLTERSSEKTEKPDV